MPGSGEHLMMWRKNYQHLRGTDFVKFPVYGMSDLDYAFEKIHELTVFEECRATFAISPVSYDYTCDFEFGKEWNKDSFIQKIIERIKNSGRSDIILNVQLHKLLNFE
jgi:hypothetical protein